MAEGYATILNYVDGSRKHVDSLLETRNLVEILESGIINSTFIPKIISIFPYTVNSSYQVHALITLRGKKYAVNKVYVLNKQVSKYTVMLFFSNTSILSFVPTGYGFMLLCMSFVHLA